MRRVKNHIDVAGGEAGFSLIEVLAALMVFSVGIIGLTHSGTQSTQSVGVLQDKMLASVVADNQLVQYRLRPLVNGVQSGRSSQMSKDFTYTIETRPTEVANFYTVDIKVRREGSPQVIVNRTAFRGKGAL